MPATAVELNTVHKGCTAAKLVVDQLKPALDALNILYDSAGGVKSTLTQEEMDAVPALSELTKTQLDDGMYALTATLKASIDGMYTQLVQLAARG